MKEIKGLIFDYGGTLDSNGQHWAAVIWESYQKVGVPIARELFNEAYVYAERKMARHPLIAVDFNFLKVMQTKVEAQFEYLKNQSVILDTDWINAIAEDGYALARTTVQGVEQALNNIHEKYPIVMVSNFYGNLSAVLRDFGIYNSFDKIIESAVVGVRKPDPAIYALGVDAIGLDASECLVIGDSYSKDMVPAKACGCQTLWLKGEGWSEDEESDTVAADYTFYDIKELEGIIKNWTSLGTM
jgi:HAD superfamily hydrolase (TIGR01549 family)